MKGYLWCLVLIGMGSLLVCVDSALPEDNRPLPEEKVNGFPPSFFPLSPDPHHSVVSLLTVNLPSSEQGLNLKGSDPSADGGGEEEIPEEIRARSKHFATRDSRLAVALLLATDLPSETMTPEIGDRAGKQGGAGELPEDYFIGPEDVLEVSVWRNEALSKVVSVRPDGKISLPLIGEISATGLTPLRLRELIVERLKEFKETPEVSVIVQQVNSYVIYILGEVAHPGKHQLRQRTTLLQAITLAGGFTPFASRNKIVVLRRGEDQQAETQIKVRYDDIISGREVGANILLKPGDTLIVP